MPIIFEFRMGKEKSDEKISLNPRLGNPVIFVGWVINNKEYSSPFILSFQNLLQKVSDKSLLTCGEGSDVDLAEKNVSPFRNSKHVEIPKKRNDTMGTKTFRSRIRIRGGERIKDLKLD